MFLPTGIAERAQGLKLINICQVVQRSALMLVAKKSSGIHAPEHLQGRKVGLWPGEYRIQPEAFFRKYNLTVTVVRQTTTMNLFLRDGVDGASAMWYNEYHTLLNAGLDPEDLTTFFYSDHGMNFPEDGIYCMEETLRRNPEVCRMFVEASLEGWRYAFAHPGLALAIVMKHIGAANTTANQVHQQWMLARMRDIIVSPGSDWATGILNEQAYSRVCQELSRRGMFLRSPPFPNFYVSLLAHAEK